MTVVIKDGLLIDGTGDEPVPGGTVVVEDGRVAAAGSETAQEQAILDRVDPTKVREAGFSPEQLTEIQPEK